MGARRMIGTTRRGFLGHAVAVTGLSPLAAAGAQTDVPPDVRSAPPAPYSAASSSATAAAAGYRTLDAEEAAFTEALVRALCPADHLTPDGVACGLAQIIDRELAGGFAQRASRFAPIHWEHAACTLQQTHADRHYFRAGVSAINAVSQDRCGTSFAELAPATAITLIGEIASGAAANGRFPLSTWVTQSLQPLLVGAALAEPVHQAYSNKVLWKVIGSA